MTTRENHRGVRGRARGRTYARGCRRPSPCGVFAGGQFRRAALRRVPEARGPRRADTGRPGEGRPALIRRRVRHGSTVVDSAGGACGWLGQSPFAGGRARAFGSSAAVVRRWTSACFVGWSSELNTPVYVQSCLGVTPALSGGVFFCWSLRAAGWGERHQSAAVRLGLTEPHDEHAAQGVGFGDFEGAASPGSAAA